VTGDLRGRFRAVLGEHGRVSLDELDATVEALVSELLIAFGSPVVLLAVEAALVTTARDRAAGSAVSDQAEAVRVIRAVRRTVLEGCS
jgi:hypothetical protein